jgi:hypothetical protein
MVATLRVQIAEVPSETSIHRFRNFGEDVYRALRDRCSIDIQEIDRSTTSFAVREIHARNVRSISREILALAAQHGFGSTATVKRE